VLEGAKQNVKNRLTLERINCSLAKVDLRRLCDILQERTLTAADHEVANFQQGQQTAEQYEQNKVLLREAFALRITVTGHDGRELFGTIPEVFDSPNFPEEVRSSYVNSGTVLKGVYNYFPRNSFELFVDFSRPAVFDFTILPSQQTPNGSRMNVEGFEATWANGLFHELQRFFESKSAPLEVLHRHSVYDVILWFIGLPLGFWLCFKFAPLTARIEANTSGFVGAAANVYIFLAALFLFRALFHYARWVFPIVEYKHERSRTLMHRAALGTLTLGLIGSVIYDALKALLP